MSRILKCDYCEEEYDYDEAWMNVVTPEKFCSPACEDEADEGPEGAPTMVPYGDRMVEL